MVDHNVASIQGFQASYIDVAGLPTWHEVAGQGPPLVLLHGGFSGAASWSAQAQALVQAGFRVYVPERRGHAHTRDVDGPLTYEAMAGDTIAYLEATADTKSDLVGRSDGAVVALLVALWRPDLVERLVLISKFFNSSGRVPDSEFERWLYSDQAMELLRKGYDPVSPDGPEHFPVIHAKTMEMIGSGPELDSSTLVDVSAPTLVLQGDRDVVTIEHSAAIAAALGNGRLAVLPGTHALTSESPEVVNALLTSFLGQGAAVQ